VAGHGRWGRKGSEVDAGPGNIFRAICNGLMAWWPARCFEALLQIRKDVWFARESLAGCQDESWLHWLHLILVTSFCSWSPVSALFSYTRAGLLTPSILPLMKFLLFPFLHLLDNLPSPQAITEDMYKIKLFCHFNKSRVIMFQRTALLWKVNIPPLAISHSVVIVTK
jgi:hypothetical protein